MLLFPDHFLADQLFQFMQQYCPLNIASMSFVESSCGIFFWLFENRCLELKDDIISNGVKNR